VPVGTGKRGQGRKKGRETPRNKRGFYTEKSLKQKGKSPVERYWRRKKKGTKKGKRAVIRLIGS